MRTLAMAALFAVLLVSPGQAQGDAPSVSERANRYDLCKRAYPRPWELADRLRCAFLTVPSSPLDSGTDPPPPLEEPSVKADLEAGLQQLFAGPSAAPAEL